jgi:uncharacterized membrane protein
MLQVRTVHRTDREQLWSGVARATTMLAATSAATTLALGLQQHELFGGQYFWRNRLADEASRSGLVSSVVIVATATVLAALLFLWARRRDPKAVTLLQRWASWTAPLGPLAYFPCLFSWRLYEGHDLVFLALVLLDALALGSTLRAALRAGLPGFGWLNRTALPTAGNGSRDLTDTVCAVVVCAAVAGYVVFFSYNLVVWHRSVRSGFDLAIEDNILWNLLHGGSFFHASPVFGPTGSHFGRHATLISYLLLPFYALHQNAETLHVVESVFSGAAAAPLFLFARRRIGAVPALVFALAYLLHPAVEEGNLYEMQYTKLGPFFFWSALWLLSAGRLSLGLVAAALTVSVREDVASWVVLLGLFVLFSDELPVPKKVGAALAAGAGVYVVMVKFVIMPRYIRQGFDLVFMYRELLPEGRSSFAWVVASVLGNPAFALETLFEPDKLLYVLELLVPLALLPLRRSVGFWALVPGALFCLLATRYPPLVDIHYQYSPHVFAFEFPAAVIVLAQVVERRAAGDETRFRGEALALLVAVLAATLPCSYQYGALFQTHTSRGGPSPFKFGWDEEGRERYRAIRVLKTVVPATARVAASALTVPQFSSRRDDYSLSLGLYDADWIVAPTRASEYVPEESARVKTELDSGTFGVVAIEGPFFAARRGEPTTRNQELYRLLGTAR